MKKRIVVMFILVLALVATSFTLVQSAGPVQQINGQDQADTVEGEGAAALTCNIRNTAGAVVQQVRRSSPGTWGIRGYWVVFGGGPAWIRATVTIIINNAGLPEHRIVQHFSIAPAYAGETRTPFAITDWPGAAWGGNGRVIVDTSDGVSTTTCTCTFTTRPF